MGCKLIDLTNKNFGRWLVIERSGKNKWGQVLWKCLCQCGTIKILVGTTLKNGMSKSCGCHTNQAIRDTLTTHGHSHANNGNPTREYHSWTGMRNRCTSPSSDKYYLYGGRGIKVCDRWLTSFENFLVDMGPRPPNYTLDRIDVNGNYEPSNCRWASSREQANNRRIVTNLQVELDSLKTKLAEYQNKYDII